MYCNESVSPGYKHWTALQQSRLKSASKENEAGGAARKAYSDSFCCQKIMRLIALTTSAPRDQIESLL